MKYLKSWFTFLYNKDDIFKEKSTYLQKKETRRDIITQWWSTYISICLILITHVHTHAHIYLCIHLKHMFIYMLLWHRYLSNWKFYLNVYINIFLLLISRNPTPQIMPVQRKLYLKVSAMFNVLTQRVNIILLFCSLYLTCFWLYS